jgi:hypothetical protein
MKRDKEQVLVDPIDHLKDEVTHTLDPPCRQGYIMMRAFRILALGTRIQ